MKTVISVLSWLSLLPIILYPGALVAAIMAFGSPGASRMLMPYLFAVPLLGYPLFILGMRHLATTQESLLFAVLSLIPLVVFVVWGYYVM